MYHSRFPHSAIILRSRYTFEARDTRHQMYTSGIIGCLVLLYGPYAIAAVLVMLRQKPQLVVVWLMSALCSVASLILVGVLYAAVQARTTGSGAALPAVLVLLQLLLQLPLRFAVFALWQFVQRQLRHERQVMVWSSRRMTPVSCAVGLGFGFTSMLVTGGLMLDATRQFAHYTPGAAAYNLDVCPQLPVLLQTSLQSFLLTLCHASWGVSTGQPALALREFGVRAYFTDLWRRIGPSSGVTAIIVSENDLLNSNGGSDSFREFAAPHRPVQLPAAAEKQPAVHGTPDEDEPLPAHGHTPRTREEHESSDEATAGPVAAVSSGGVDDTDADPPRPSQVLAASTATGSGQPRRLVRVRPYQGIIPADTVLTEHLDVAFASIVLTLVFQILFSCLSLFHAGAFSNARMSEVATRGCVVSLPLQLVITMLSVLWALWIAREEHVKLD